MLRIPARSKQAKGRQSWRQNKRQMRRLIVLISARRLIGVCIPATGLPPPSPATRAVGRFRPLVCRRQARRRERWAGSGLLVAERQIPPQHNTRAFRELKRTLEGRIDRCFRARFHARRTRALLSGPSGRVPRAGGSAPVFARCRPAAWRQARRGPPRSAEGAPCSSPPALNDSPRSCTRIRCCYRSLK